MFDSVVLGDKQCLYPLWNDSNEKGKQEGSGHSYCFSTAMRALCNALCLVSCATHLSVRRSVLLTTPFYRGTKSDEDTLLTVL